MLATAVTGHTTYQITSYFQVRSKRYQKGPPSLEQETKFVSTKSAVDHLIRELNPKAIPQLHLHLRFGISVEKLSHWVHVNVAWHLQFEPDVSQRLLELLKIDLKAFPQAYILYFSELDIFCLDSLLSSLSNLVVPIIRKPNGYTFNNVTHWKCHILKYISFVPARVSFEITITIFLELNMVSNGIQFWTMLTSRFLIPCLRNASFLYALLYSGQTVIAGSRFAWFVSLSKDCAKYRYENMWGCPSKWKWKYQTEGMGKTQKTPSQHFFDLHFHHCDFTCPFLLQVALDT